MLGQDPAATADSIRRFSERDARQFPKYEQFLDRVARTLEPMLDVAPPDPARLRWRDLGPLLSLARGAWQLRGESGGRQVPNAKVGLAQTLGLGGNGTAAILKR